MPNYSYECKCGACKDVIKPMSQCGTKEVCECGLEMKKIITVPAITGTMDSFGIGKSFKDDKTGKVIDNWKSWEKAGYSDIEGSSTMPSSVRAGAKRKLEKIQKYDTKKKFSV